MLYEIYNDILYIIHETNRFHPRRKSALIPEYLRGRDEHMNCIRDQHMLDLQMLFHSNNFHFLVRLEFLLALQPEF